MSLPNYQEFMRPLLQVYAEIKEPRKIAKLEQVVANKMHLTSEQQGEMIRSKRNTVVYSRLHWASYYMYIAGLLRKPQPGYYEITPAGISALKSGAQINDAYLSQFPDFVAFMNRFNMKIKNTQGGVQVETCSVSQDPEESIDSAISEINAALEDEILTSVKNIHPQRFEQVVVELMEAMDYGTGKLTPYTADGGIDGIIYEDELGLSKIYLQAKRYSDGKVNEKDMQNFIGALASNSVSKGVFMTTSYFSDKARSRADKAQNMIIRLIDGAELAMLMRKHNLGARAKKNYDIKEFDETYFQ